MNGGHTDFENLILRLPDDDLTQEEKRALQEHLNGCADCRRLFRAVRDATEAMDDQAEPPAALADGVMARIRAAEAEKTASPKDISERRDLDRRAQGRKMRRRRGLGAFVAVAAVLVLAVGGGLFAARSLFNRDNAPVNVAQSVAMEAPAQQEAPAAAAGLSGAADGNAMHFAAAEEMIAEAEEAAQADSGSALVYPIDAPAHVKEGCEADFEAVLQDMGWPDGVPATAFRAIAYVEYRGVIYEFLSDPEEEFLLWRDAAEGVDIIHTPATVDTLFFLIS